MTGQDIQMQDGLSVEQEAGVHDIGDFLLKMARLFVDHKQDLKVEILRERVHTTYIMRVNKTDFGRLIGKNGAYAFTMRSLVKAYGHSLGLLFCDLMIEDPNPAKRGPNSSGQFYRW